MCGLYGILFQRQPDAATIGKIGDLISVLAVASAERGTDATGLAHVKLEPKITMFKTNIDSYSTVNSEPWTRMLQALQTNTAALMGHTRKKTIGVNTIDNAHPYLFSTDYGHFVGAHNGTITNWRSFVHNTAPLSVQTDSGNVLASLSEYPSNHWDEHLERIRGKYAFTISRNNRFYIAKNKQAPCHWTKIKKLGILVYASTEHILQASLALSQLDFDSIRSYKSNRIYKYKLHTGRVEVVRYRAEDDKSFITTATPSVTVSSNITTYDPQKIATFQMGSYFLKQEEVFRNEDLPLIPAPSFWPPVRQCVGCKAMFAIIRLAVGAKGFVCTTCNPITSGKKNAKI